MDKLDYKASGVDIEAGEDLVDRIKPFAKSTSRNGVMGDLGGFGALFDLKAEGFIDPVLVSGTDGVGTKLKIAIEMGIHDTVGVDLVAMCANDILVQGAQPLFFMDYFATGKLEVDIAQEVIKGISVGCQKAGAALLGGETAEMPDFYPDGHYDLAGFCVGAVERNNILPKIDHLSEGDRIYALPSSGFHSNGYSLIRKLVEKLELKYNNICPWNDKRLLGEDLLTPTKIYVKELLTYLNNIKALCHITGGGISGNIKRILPENLSSNIDLGMWELDPCFKWAKEVSNLTDNDMLETFNCGIGMIIISDNMPDIDGIIEIGEIIKGQDNQVIYSRKL